MRFGLLRAVPKCVIPRRSLASTSAINTKPALLLWFGNDRLLPHSLLVPSSAQHFPVDPNVQSIMDLVEQHYSQVDDIGGMGESDKGVWFAGGTEDALNHVELIHDCIQGIKEHRHGIPFGMYSSGLLPSPKIDWDLVAATKCKLQISLFAGNPKEYATASGGSEKDFAQVCGVIATAAEYTTVEVGVLEDHAASAHSLAHSLGAQEVLVYNKDDCIKATKTD